MKIALEGRPALVVGSCGKVGPAIVAALERSGAVVSERAFLSAGGKIDPERSLDFGAETNAAAAAKAFVEGNGTPDVLVLVSAGVDAGPDDSPAEPGELDRFAFAARAFEPFVDRIINVISAAGVVPLRGAAAFSAHHAALASMTRALAMELAPDVVVNALAVGAVADDGNRMVSHSPLKRSASAGGSRQRGALPRRSDEHLHHRPRHARRWRLVDRLRAEFLMVALLTGGGTHGR